MKSHRATIRDVAREAGVSVTTVSAALNGKGRVAPGTKSLVEETANRLNYSPSQSAAHLTSGRTGTLVFAVSALADDSPDDTSQADWGIDYYFQVFNAASTVAFKHNFLMAMLPFNESRNTFLNAADGLLLVDPQDNDPLIEEAVSRGLPCVTIGRNSRGVSWVDNDFFAATSLSIDHLNSSGSSAPALFLSETASPYVRDEISAYLDWCLDKSIEPTIIRAAGPKIDEAELAISRALEDADRRFDSVITTLDTLALATAQAVKRIGLNVPQDLQLLSLVDSRYLSHNLQASITALDLCPSATAEAAINMLMSELEDSSQHQTKIVPTLLRLRESTIQASNDTLNPG